ncbi:hypothetical protein QCA50_005610 [Cerrena zonata]|uniref:Yeast cell wall synthesis Kre9/Knh1-like N-terminal domain-containing protein n=1 Tax=Cerrena zonata TaxID=2478898 RepID=A0AAW0GFP2_9APHY
MFFAPLAAALALIPAALATITITQPSSSDFWVQNTTNIIAWSFDQGDTNPISIIVTNSNNTFLNGNFSIAEFVDLSNGTFTVTNVTLVEADGYTVSFVNPINQTVILATSQSFSVKPAGTTPASSGTPTSGSTSTSASASASGTSSGTPSSSASPLGNTNNNAAISGFSAQGIIGLIAACGVASVSAVLL